MKITIEKVDNGFTITDQSSSNGSGYYLVSKVANSTEELCKIVKAMGVKAFEKPATIKADKNKKPVAVDLKKLTDLTVGLCNGRMTRDTFQVEVVKLVNE